MMRVYAGTAMPEVAVANVMSAYTPDTIKAKDAMRVLDYIVLDRPRVHSAEDYRSNWIENTMGASGVIVIVDVTSGSGLNIVPRMEMENPGALQPRVTIFAGSQITGVGTRKYALFPGATATGWTDARSLALPRRWRWFMDSTGGSVTTYSVSALLVGV
jgi:hypothetical protein